MTISTGTASAHGPGPFGVLMATSDSAFFNPLRRIAATATHMAGTIASAVPRSTSQVGSRVGGRVGLSKDGFEAATP